MVNSKSFSDVIEYNCSVKITSMTELLENAEYQIVNCDLYEIDSKLKYAEEIRDKLNKILDNYRSIQRAKQEIKSELQSFKINTDKILKLKKQIEDKTMILYELIDND